MNNPMVEARNSFELHATSFKNYFGVSLKQYWHPLFGFDVIGFDDKFLIPKFRYEDGKTSMNDCIRKEYGEKAAKMIEELI